MRERADRLAEVAEHDEVGLERPARPVVGDHRHAAGGQRRAHRAPEVELAAACPRRWSIASRAASRRASGWISRRSATRSARVAPRKFTCSIVGRIAVRATVSASVSSASRRRTSASTRRSKRAIRSLIIVRARRSASPPRSSPGSTCSSRPAISVCARHPLEHRHPRPGRLARHVRPGTRPNAATASRATPSSRRSSPSRRYVGELGADPVAHRVLERAAVRGVRIAGGGSVPDAGARRFAGHRRVEEVEHAVERRPVHLPLDQRRGERGAQLLAVEQVDRAASTRHGVEPLGDRHRQPGLAQRGDEADVPVEQRLLSPAGRAGRVPWPPARGRSGA